MGKQSKRAGRVSIFIALAVALLIIGLLVYNIEYKGKPSANKLQEEIDSTNQKIEEAKREQINLENEIKYRETDDYIKEEAKEIFGLRDPDDTIFLPGEEADGSKKD